MLADWDSADLSRTPNLQFAAQVVRLGAQSAGIPHQSTSNVLQRPAILPFLGGQPGGPPIPRRQTKRAITKMVKVVFAVRGPNQAFRDSGPPQPLSPLAFWFAGVHRLRNSVI